MRLYTEPQTCNEKMPLLVNSFRRGSYLVYFHGSIRCKYKDVPVRGSAETIHSIARVISVRWMLKSTWQWKISYSIYSGVPNSVHAQRELLQSWGVRTLRCNAQHKQDCVDKMQMLISAKQSLLGRLKDLESNKMFWERSTRLIPPRPVIDQSPLVTQVHTFWKNIYKYSTIQFWRILCAFVQRFKNFKYNARR